MNAKSVRFRQVQKSDERYFLAWWHTPQLIHLTSGDTRQLTTEQDHELFEKLRHSQTAKHWVITVNETPIGHAALRGKNPVEIHIMIGSPKLWSRGYGTAIAEQLRRRLTSFGVTHARMFVWRQNKRSIALGKKFGFRQVGRVRRRAGSRTRIYLILDWRSGNRK